MNKKVALPLTVLIIILLALAGCSDEEGGGGEPKKEEKSATLPPISGWIDSPDSSAENPQRTVEGKLSANQSEIISVTFVLTFQDSDENHSTTDEGSDPDELELKVTGSTSAGRRIKEIKSAATEGGTGKLELTVPAQANQTSESDGESDGESDEPEFVNSNLEYEISGKKFGGGKNPTGPGGILPVPFLVYLDQGAAYTLEISYRYLAPVE